MSYLMNKHEQRMCELQADFFELSVSSFPCGSSFFIAKFMQSPAAKELDNVDDPYNFSSPNNLIAYMKEEFPSLNKERGEQYPKSVLRWIGYIYRAWNIISKRTSSYLYKKMKANKLLSLYDSFHTFSPEYCVERLEEIVEEINKMQISDYEIYKRIVAKKDIDGARIRDLEMVFGTLPKEALNDDDISRE